MSMTIYLCDHPCILVLPVWDGLTQFNPFSFLSSLPTVFGKKYSKSRTSVQVLLGQSGDSVDKGGGGGGEGAAMGVPVAWMNMLVL